ncbi:TPA: hypothetical protein NR332_002894 [Listeria innocua]|nr:hypothetical protein [Listeria innocua]
MKIKVTNPYHDKEYSTDDITIRRWNEFLEHFQMGNEQIIGFTDKNTGEYVTINPSHFASVEVSE